MSLCSLYEAAQTQQGVGVRLVAAELLELNHGVLGVTALKYVLLEAGGCLLVEDTLLLEQLPCVGLQHLGPQIGVVTRSIAVVAEDMLEVG